MTASAPSQDSGAARLALAERSLSSPEAGLSHLRSMLTSGEGESARVFILELAARYPDSEAVAQFARVLARPVTRLLKGRQGRCLDRDYAWLRAHAREYAGCWLAICEDNLIASAPDLKTVVAQLRSDPRHEQALLHFEPEPEE